jgi:Ca2+-binding EF-hand superfamily protein
MNPGSVRSTDWLSVTGATPRPTPRPTPRHTPHLTPRLTSRNPRRRRSSAFTARSHLNLFGVLKKLIAASMITEHDFASFSSTAVVPDHREFSLARSQVPMPSVENPLNPPTLTAPQLWALVKARGGIDPPAWQRQHAFLRIDARRTGTVSWNRFKAACVLLDAESFAPASAGRNSKGKSSSSTTTTTTGNSHKLSRSQVVQRWIDSTASDALVKLAHRLREKHKTNSGHELFAHFARACLPAERHAHTGPAAKISFPDFCRGIRHYQIQVSSNLDTAERMFSSLDPKDRGYIVANVFIPLCLECGTEGHGFEAGHTDPRARKAAKDKRKARMGKHPAVSAAPTPASVVEALRSRLIERSSGDLGRAQFKAFASAACLGKSSQIGYNGVFTFEAFCNGFRQLGLTNVAADRKCLRTVFDALDANHDGEIDFDEFMMIIGDLDLGMMDSSSHDHHLPTLGGGGDSGGSMSRRSASPQPFSSRSRSAGSLLRQSQRTNVTNGDKEFRMAQSAMYGGPGSIDYAERARRNNAEAQRARKKKILESTVFQKWKQMYALFQACDSESKGSLGRHDFGDVLSRCGLRLDKGEFKTLWEQFDADQSGRIDYKEFLGHFVEPGPGDTATNALSEQIKSVDAGAVDVRRASVRDYSLKHEGNLVQDPEVLALVDDVNAGRPRPLQPSMLKTLGADLRKQEISNGIVEMRTLYRVLQWHGIGPDMFEVPESTRCGGGVKYRPIVRALF